MQRLFDLLRREREKVTYLFFGVLTTLVNIAGYSLLSAQGLSTGWANGIALAVSILFAYFTNRRWVFLSRAHGRAALREFGSFILCRIGTGLIDQAIMLIGVDRIGAALFPSPEAVAFGMDALDIWGTGVKIFANVIVIVLNYILSKVLILRAHRRSNPDNRDTNL